MEIYCIPVVIGESITTMGTILTFLKALHDTTAKVCPYCWALISNNSVYRWLHTFRLCILDNGSSSKISSDMISISVSLIFSIKSSVTCNEEKNGSVAYRKHTV